MSFWDSLTALGMTAEHRPFVAHFLEVAKKQGFVRQQAEEAIERYFRDVQLALLAGQIRG